MLKAKMLIKKLSSITKAVIFLARVLIAKARTELKLQDIAKYPQQNKRWLVLLIPILC